MSEKIPSFETKTLRTFKAKKDTYNKFKSIVVSKNENIGDKFNEFMEDYVLKYAGAKDTPSLDKFVENPEFRATPSFPLSAGNIDRKKWINHLQACQTDKKYLQQIEWDAQTIGTLARKMNQYGTVNVYD